MPPAAWKRCWAPRGTCTFASPTFQHWQPLDWGQTWWVLSSLNRPLDFCYKYSSCWACLPFILITYSGARSRTRVSSYISKWLVYFCSSLVEQWHLVRTYLVLLTYPKNCFACQLWTICPSKKYVYYVSRIYTGQLYKMHFLTCVVQSRVYVCAEPSQAHNLTSLQLWTTWSTVQPGKILHVLLPVSEWPELCVWTNMRLKFTNRHVGNLIYLVLLLHSHSQFATLIALLDSYPTW